jgi:methyltransferase (TIGR00027 family)
MLKAPKRIVFPVPDLPPATRWYRRILGTEPVFASPVAVQFAVGAVELVLVPTTETRIGLKEGQFVSWLVDDVDASYTALLAAGSTPVSEPRTVMLSRQARVADPYGNHLGLTGSLEPCRSRTVAEVPSDSALAVALCRALGARDPRAEIRGHDLLADVFLPPDMVASLLEASTATWLRAFVARGGAYEFFLARTAWFDALVRQALADNLPQVVLLGAGYDTRAFRFAELNRRTRFFELDVAPTQARKQRCLTAAGVKMPPAVTFAPIDFTREPIGEVLLRAGYDPTRRTLFVWEGVAYYLPSAAVAETLAAIGKSAPVGSTVAFDYMLDGPGVAERHGVSLALESMKLHYPSEPVRSRLAEDELEPLLARHGFRLLEQLDAAALERRFLMLKDGISAGKPLALFNLVHAALNEHCDDGVGPA